jgi:hypothetical protein
MRHADRHLLLLLLAGALLGLAGCAVTPATQGAASGCSQCHEMAKVLPANHAAVPEDGIAACVRCHPPRPDAMEPNPVPAKMHRAHTRVGVECATCHGLQPDGSFTLLGVAGRLLALDTEDLGRVKAAMGSWAASGYLDAAHGTRRNLMCGACHGTQLLPDDNETKLNAQCIACHGTNAQVSAKLKGRLKNPHIDPHVSHLGDIACTACHQGHQASKAYCLGCHTNFVMPIPGGAKS